MNTASTGPGALIQPTPDSEQFWTGLRAGRITVPWCDQCDTHVWYPRSLCPQCMGEVASHRTLSGEGEVYTYSVVHRGAPGWDGSVPYVFAYVSLDGGPTVLANVVGEDALEVQIGDRVRLVQDDGLATLRFARHVR